MKKLMNKEIRITSVELVEVINEFRNLESDTTGKKYTKLLHKTFMEKIRKELEILESLGLDNGKNILPVEYTDKKGENRPCYSLNRDGMLEMLNSESALVRYKTIEYINKLEEENKTLKDEKANLLLSIYNGGQSAVIAAKKLAEIESKEEVDKATKPLLPKAEFYDEIIDSTTVIGMKEVADILNVKGYGRNNLFKFLRENGILNRKNEPYRKYIDQGLFEIKESKYIVDNEVKIKPTTYVTQKGLDYIRKILNKQNKQ